MKAKDVWFRSASSSLPPARAALRDLYRAARRLHHSDPYAPARLARIADQAEYFLQDWPAEQWPVSLHSSQPLPSRSELLRLITVTRQVASTGTPLAAQSWTHAHWQQAITTLLAALTPFA